MSVLLGNLVLDGLEAPAGILCGGDQALSVHSLPGGGRIIDVMGPDDADIAWRGFLAGPTASDRARALDIMRAQGATLTLAWNSNCYAVVIASLHFTYASPWWIRYDINCKVLPGPLAEAGLSLVDPLTGVASDLSVAGAWMNTGAAMTAISAPGALNLGTQACAAAAAALAQVATGLDNGIAAADAAMNTPDVAALSQFAGALAGLLTARSYVNRAVVNFGTASA